jgi:hypothetical protein
MESRGIIQLMTTSIDYRLAQIAQLLWEPTHWGALGWLHNLLSPARDCGELALIMRTDGTAGAASQPAPWTGKAAGPCATDSEPCRAGQRWYAVLGSSRERVPAPVSQKGKQRQALKEI